MLLGYRTAARIAAAEGSEHRALELLEAMDAVGLARGLPRLCIASLADQVRLHARRFRAETCRALVRADRRDHGRAGHARKDRSGGAAPNCCSRWRTASAAIAAQEWRRALEPLARAGELAEAMGLGRVRIEAMALRAFVLDRSGEHAVPLLREAMGLADTYGLARLFVDPHPALGDWAQRVARELGDAATAESARGAALAPRSLAAPMQSPRVSGGRARASIRAWR